MRTLKTVCLIGFIILGISFISGCATTNFIQDVKQVKRLHGVAVVTNATMSRERTLKSNTLSLAENEEIAQDIASRAVALLGEKGYAVAYGPIHTVGLYGIVQKEIEVVNDIGAKDIASPPFLISPDGSRERSMAATLSRMTEGEDLDMEETPLRNNAGTRH